MKYITIDILRHNKASNILSCALTVLFHMKAKNLENAQYDEVWYSLVELMTHIDKAKSRAMTLVVELFLWHSLVLTEMDTILVLQNRWHWS